MEDDHFFNISKDENRLIELEYFFKVYLDLLSVVDFEGNFIKMNDAWANTLGYSAKELETRNFYEFIHPDDVHATMEALSKLKAKGSFLNSVNRYRSSDGSYRFIEWRSYSDGRLIYSGARDITETKNLEDALKESEKRYRNLFENASEGIYQTTPEGRYLLMNPEFARMFGYDSPRDMIESVVNIGHQLYVDPGERERLKVLLQENDRVNGFEAEVYRRDGTKFWISINAHIVRNKDDSVRCFEGTNLDITARKIAEEELLKQYQQLQEREQELHDSERRLADFINFLPDPTMAINTSGQIVLWNQAIEAMTGIKTENILGKGNYEHALPFYSSRRPMLIDLVLKPEAEAEIDGKYRSLRRVGESIMAEARLPVVNGKPRFFSGKATPLYDSRGILAGAIETMHDITEHTLAEEELINQYHKLQEQEQALQDSRQRLADIIDFLPDATLVIDEQRKVVLWNRAIEKMTGIPKDQIISRGDYEYAIPFYGERRPMLVDMAIMSVDEYSEIKDKYDFVRREGDTLFCEVYVPKTYDGQGAYLLGSASRLQDLQGNTVGAIQSIRDITERKKHEDALKKWAQIFEYAEWGVAIRSGDGQSLEMINPAFARMHGFSSEEIIGLTLFDLYAPEERNEVMKHIHLAVQLGHHVFEARRLRKDGSSFPAIVDITAVKDSDGKPAYLIGHIRDITDRKQAEEERETLRHLLNTIIDSMPSLLVALDADTRVTQWNLEAARLTGIRSEDAIGRCFSELMPSFSLLEKDLHKALTEQKLVMLHRVRSIAVSKDNYFDVMIYPMAADAVNGAVIRIDDVSDKVRMDELMIQNEKMISVGGLAAGMAHEINNPLGGIIQGAQNIERRLDASLAANNETAKRLGIQLEQIQSYIQERKIDDFVAGIRESGIRASRIVQNMLQFSRASEYRHSSFRPETMLERSLELASSDYDLNRQYDFRHIEIVREYEPGLGMIICSDIEIEQVLLNLLKNAAQALSEASDWQEKPQIIIRCFREGNMAVMEVEDNGSGMDEAVKRRIFEPFFTTKSASEGTGLGLSVAYFIITQNHGGQMMVNSIPGHGARFTIKIPFEVSDKHTA